MSNTEVFNVKVRLGGKAFAPGEPVPVGGKGGLPKEEAARLHAEFGKWKGTAPAAADAGEVRQLRADNERMAGEIEQLTADNGALAKQIKDIETAAKAAAAKASRENEQLTADNGVLAKRVEKLEAAVKAASA